MSFTARPIHSTRLAVVSDAWVGQDAARTAAIRISSFIFCIAYLPGGGRIAPLPSSAFLERGEWRLKVACLGNRRRMPMYRWSRSVSISSSTLHSEVLLAVIGDAHVKSTTDSLCQRIQVLAPPLFKGRRSRLAAHSSTAHPLASSGTPIICFWR